MKQEQFCVSKWLKNISFVTYMGRLVEEEEGETKGGLVEQIK